MLNLLIAVFNAIPVIDKWLQKFMLEYAKLQKEKSNVEFVTALHEATKNKDVTAIASSLGDKLD